MKRERGSEIFRNWRRLFSSSIERNDIWRLKILFKVERRNYISKQLQQLRRVSVVRTQEQVCPTQDVTSRLNLTRNNTESFTKSTVALSFAQAFILL